MLLEADCGVEVIFSSTHLGDQHRDTPVDAMDVHDVFLARCELMLLRPHIAEQLVCGVMDKSEARRLWKTDCDTLNGFA